MRIQFQLSFDDYRAAQRLHAMRSFWSRLGRVLNYYIYPIIGLISLILSLLLVSGRAPTHSVSTLIICGILLVCCPIYLQIRLKSCYKRTRSGSDGCQLTFDEESIGVEGQYSKGEMEWKAIHFFREDESVFLLYLALAKFIAIPKRVCSEEQIGELRSLLIQKVKQKTN
ncbi:MAG: YcxB family protein [Terracidiphilus sp.]